MMQLPVMVSGVPPSVVTVKSVVVPPVPCADKVNEKRAIHNRIAVHTFFVIFIEIRFYIVLIGAKIDVFFD